MFKVLFMCAAMLLATVPLWAASYYTSRLDDPKAVYLTPDAFPVHADGVADDSDAIQQAIDKVQESTVQGIVFVPSGRYRITKTINIWPGIRVIGYGTTRPVLVLGANTPGYQTTENFMVFFPGRRPDPSETSAQQPPTMSGIGGVNLNMPNDANPGTFYSAMSNVDIEIQDGNPMAVGVRGRYAQHCYLAHMDFNIGSGLAGIHDTGNEAEDLHFHGGRYGIIMRTPSPGWQFTLIDSSFDGQSVAAIRSHESGLTMVRPSFQNVPTAISIDPGYTDLIWIKDGRMENISGPAIIINREKTLRNEINFENVVCKHVPVFASFRKSLDAAGTPISEVSGGTQSEDKRTAALPHSGAETGRTVPGPGDLYEVKAFSQGLHYSDIGAAPDVSTIFDAATLASDPGPAPTDIPALPSTDTWVNLATLGAKGDGATDDTAALEDAIAKYRTIYLPSGKYLVTQTITLKPDTILVGLNPITTQIILQNSTPAFMGVPEADEAPIFPANRRRRQPPSPPFPGGPVPLLETPRGGTNIVTGIGLDTGGINPAAVGAKWMAGKDSMMSDVKFLGGHGSGRDWSLLYNSNHTGDSDPTLRWDAQYYSLWITNGGGGTFKNIWTASTYAQAGMAITDTSTEGRIYELSSEHHVRHEVQIRNASNWQIYALQTEEERGEGPYCMPLDIQDSSNITLANLFMYRVVSSDHPFRYAVQLTNCKNIRFRNVHSYSDSKVSFDETVTDMTHGAVVRQREFASMDVSGQPTTSASQKGRESSVVAPGASVEKLADGFDNISGGAVDPSGDLYFVDAKWQRIYKWAVKDAELSVVRDNPLSPVNLAFDKAGNLLVISSAGRGTVYTFDPKSDDDAVTVLPAQPSTPRSGMTPVLAANHWHLDADFVQGKPTVQPYQFVSPDGTTFIPAGQDFIDGTLYYGAKMHDVIRAFGLAKATIGKPFYTTDELEMQTYSAMVQPDGTLSDAKLFVEQGGEGLAVDSAGNVYIAAGQIYVYNPAGTLIDTIDVPERPIQLVFGGPDGKTLFIAARSSLYAVRTRR